VQLPPLGCRPKSRLSEAWRVKARVADVSSQRHLVLAPRTARVPLNVVAGFARQLAAMLSNGVPLIRALETLTTQTEYPHFGLVIEQVAQEVHDGSTLSRAASLHPRVFSSVWVHMVEVGEHTGGLDQSLEMIADWLEREESVRRRVVSALTYPLSVMLVSLALSVLLFTTVLPTFAGIFREMNVALPAITRLVMGLTWLLCQPWAWLLAVLLGLAAWQTWSAIWRSPRQSRLVFSLLLQVPGVGRLLYHGAQTRYCSAGHALLSCGTDLLRTLRLAGQASSSPVLEHDSKRVVKAIQQGLTLSAAMLETPQLYSTTLIQMVRAGEEASLLPEMLQRVAHFHDLELDASIELLSATLEPVLLMGVSAVVGTIVLSIYLPMYSTLMNLTG